MVDLIGKGYTWKTIMAHTVFHMTKMGKGDEIQRENLLNSPRFFAWLPLMGADLSAIQGNKSLSQKKGNKIFLRCRCCSLYRSLPKNNVFHILRETVTP